MDEPKTLFDFMNMIQEHTGKPVSRFENLTGFLDHKARVKGIPLHGQFELTPFCNFSCKMCYAHLTPEQISGQSVLPVSIWKDLIHQAWEAGMMRTTLTGGECLAYPGFDELFLYLHSLGCEVSILTNGFLLDEERIRFFQNHMPSKIQITLYGCNDDVYERVTGQRAFSRVINNIQCAIDAKLPVIINVTPNVYLGEDVFETMRIGKSLSNAFMVNAGIFSPREETGRSSQRDDPELEMYVRIYKYLNELNGRENRMIPEDKLPVAGGSKQECNECGMRCGGGRSGFVIDWKGTMMPCNRMNMICGYPLKQGFASAWENVNQASNNWPRTPECNGCVYEKVCNNCAANMIRFIESGKPPISICERTKTFVRNGVWQLPDCE